MHWSAFRCPHSSHTSQVIHLGFHTFRSVSLSEAWPGGAHLLLPSLAPYVVSHIHRLTSNFELHDTFFFYMQHHHKHNELEGRFRHYLDASADLFAVGERGVEGLCVLWWDGLLWPLSLLLGVHPIQEDTLSPKHCGHHSQRPGPTPHLHTTWQSEPKSPCRKKNKTPESWILCRRQKAWGCPRGSQKHKSPNGEGGGEGDQRNAASGTPRPRRDCQTDCCRRCSPSWWALSQRSVAGALLTLARGARRLTQLWNVSSRMVQGNDRSAQIWQQINPLVRFFTLSALLGGEVWRRRRRRWRWRRRRGCTGGKRRGREEGRQKLRVGCRERGGLRDGWQYSPFPPQLSPAASHTEQWIQTPAGLLLVWERCRIHQSLDQKMQLSVQNRPAGDGWGPGALSPSCLLIV